MTCRGAAPIEEAGQGRLQRGGTIGLPGCNDRRLVIELQLCNMAIYVFVVTVVRPRGRR